jgi:hypothetical protein
VIDFKNITGSRAKPSHFVSRQRRDVEERLGWPTLGRLRCNSKDNTRSLCDASHLTPNSKFKKRAFSPADGVFQQSL